MFNFVTKKCSYEFCRQARDASNSAAQQLNVRVQGILARIAISVFSKYFEHADCDMILAFLAFTLVYASCDPINLAAERMTICTRIENITLMDMSGLLSSLEKFTIDLAEKQANGTALKDSTAIKFAVNAVDNGNDTITERNLHAASWNMTCNMSSYSSPHFNKIRHIPLPPLPPHHHVAKP